jgi:hypothetical protein
MKFCLPVAAAILLYTAPVFAAQGDCGQPISNGPQPTATDCLFILNAAVGVTQCDPTCVCDVNGSGGNPNATDALICLNAAVGVPDLLQCAATCFGTTTTSTTTTTMPAGADADNDGLLDADDPCPSDAMNTCYGDVAFDRTIERDVRINADSRSDHACAGNRVDCRGNTWYFDDWGWNIPNFGAPCQLDDCNLGGVETIFGCDDEMTQDLFRCEHWNSPATADLTYSFDVPDGQYLVNLLFANTWPDTAAIGSRVFSITMEEAVVYPAFDQVLAAGGSGIGVVRSAIVNVTDGDGLLIEFGRITENPSIKGLEVLASPDN